MLLRSEPGCRIAIPQPAHAGVAGQLAAAWGNAGFPAPRPHRDVALAATLHDIGWTAWERTPTRDPATGWPRQFGQVSPLIHVDLWRDGVATARLFGRYAALLVSRHADTIYTRHFDSAAATEAERDAVRRLLDEQHGLQRDWMASLRADPGYGDLASEEAVEDNRLHLAAVDELSLRLCWGVDAPCTVAEVPAAGGRRAALSLRPASAVRAADGAVPVAVAPWPFAAGRLRVTAEGSALAQPFDSDAALRRGLAAAPAVTVAVDLLPG